MTSSALGLGGPVTTKATSYDVIRETIIVNGSTGESTVTSEISNENTEPTIGVTTTVDNRPNYTTTTPTKEGSEFKATTYPSPSQENVAIAAFSDGSFVQVWQSMYQDGNGFGIYGQIFDAAGSKYGSKFQINTTTNLDQIHPEVTRLQDNSFAVIWSSNQGDGDGYGVIGRTFNSEGGAITEEFIINTYTSGNQGNHVKVDRPDGGDDTAIESLAEGQFVVTWKSQNQDGDQDGVYAQRFDDDGSKLGSEFQINTYTNSYQHNVFVENLSDGEFIASWQSNGQDAAYMDIFSQIFSTTAGSFEETTSVNTTSIPSITTRTNDTLGPALDSSSNAMSAVKVLDKAIDTVRPQYKACFPA